MTYVRDAASRESRLRRLVTAYAAEFDAIGKGEGSPQRADDIKRAFRRLMGEPAPIVSAPNQHLVGKRVQLPAWDGSWMQGDRYGVITSISRDGERFYVKTDKANATRRYSVAELGTDNAASLV